MFIWCKIVRNGVIVTVYSWQNHFLFSKTNTQDTQ